MNLQIILEFLILLLLLILAFGSFDSTKTRIAVDYGPRLVGVAVSDIYKVVRPLSTLSNNGDLCFLSHQILTVARAQGATEVVVGLPVDSNGKVHHNVRNFNGRLCLNFAQVLNAITTATMPNVRVVLADERYTTKEAKVRMKSDKIKASLDAMAAACLLERYIQDDGEGSVIAPICDYPIPKSLQYFDYDIVRQHISDQYYDPPSQKDLDRQMIEDLKRGIVKHPKFYQLIQTQEDPHETLDHKFWDSYNITHMQVEMGSNSSQESCISSIKPTGLESEKKSIVSLDLNEVNIENALRERNARRKKGTLKKLYKQ